MSVSRHSPSGDRVNTIINFVVTVPKALVKEANEREPQERYMSIKLIVNINVSHIPPN